MAWDQDLLVLGRIILRTANTSLGPAIRPHLFLFSHAVLQSHSRNAFLPWGPGGRDCCPGGRCDDGTEVNERNKLLEPIIHSELRYVTPVQALDPASDQANATEARRMT